jgi:hypothetical protein
VFLVIYQALNTHDNRKLSQDTMTSTIGIPIKLLNEAQVSPISTPRLFAIQLQSTALP